MERLVAEPTVLAGRPAAETAGARGGKSSPIQFRQWRLILTIGVAAISLLAFFVRPVLWGQIPVHGDLGGVMLAFRDFYARCLRQGEAFDWMPQLFGGYDLTGGGAYGPYHPLNWLLYRWLPLDIAFNAEVFLPIVLLGTGTFVFLRKYINLAGACMGALVASFSLEFIVYLHCPQMTGVLAQIPWLLAAIGAAVASRTAAQRCWACAAIALVTGSQVLLAFPQAWWYSAIAASLFAVCMLVGQRAGWRAWLAVGGGLALGLGLGAVQFLTMYSFFQTSTRAVADLATLPYPIAEPKTFVEIFAPYKTWNGFVENYFGAVPLVLGLWWLTARRILPESLPAPTMRSGASLPSDRARRGSILRRLSLWAVLLALISGLLSMGLRGKLYYLQMLLPGVKSLREPCRILIVTEFSVAILTGIAFAGLVSLVYSGRKAPWRHLLLPWMAVGVALLLSAWFAAHGPHSLLGHAFIATGPLLIGGAAVALTLAARGRPLGLFLMVFMTAIDFGTFSVSNPGAGVYFTRKLPTFEQFLARCSGPPTANEGRVFYQDGRDCWVSRVNYLSYHGYRAINGYTALYPRQCLDYGDLNALRVAEVAWVWQPVKSSSCVPGWGPGGPPVDGGWRHVSHPLPRVRLVSQAVLSTAPREDLKKIDVDSTVLVSHPLKLASSRPGTAELLEDRPGKIGIRLEVPQRQLLVVSESYNDGWQARIDGRAVPLEQVNGDFFGCVVEQGNHYVDFAFLPASLRIGKMISLTSLAIVLGMVVVPVVGLRRRSQPERSSIAVHGRVSQGNLADKASVQEDKASVNEEHSSEDVNEHAGAAP